MSAAAARALWVCIVLSALMHVTVFFAFALMGGGGTIAGEQGVGGGGGDTVEITVAGPELTDEPRPGVAPQPEPEPPRPEQDEVAESPPEPEEPPRPTVAERRVHHADPVRIPAEPADEEAEPSEPTPPAPPASSEVAASGTDSEETSPGRLEGPDGARDLILGSAGLLPGDNGLRVLLPEPTECPDPIEGTWRAHKFSPLYGDWAHFTLHIQRDGDRLSGRIVTRLWQGGAFDREPPPCRIGSHDYTVSMQAAGRVNGNRITFGARNYRVVRAHCPSPFFEYNPDRFSGVIDPLTEEFHSVNNDGGRDVNAPYEFQRVSCEP